MDFFFFLIIEGHWTWTIIIHVNIDNISCLILDSLIVNAGENKRHLLGSGRDAMQKYQVDQFGRTNELVGSAAFHGFQSSSITIGESNALLTQRVPAQCPVMDENEDEDRGSCLLDWKCTKQDIFFASLVFLEGVECSVVLHLLSYNEVPKSQSTISAFIFQSNMQYIHIYIYIYHFCVHFSVKYAIHIYIYIYIL